MVSTLPARATTTIRKPRPADTLRFYRVVTDCGQVMLDQASEAEARRHVARWNASPAGQELPANLFECEAVITSRRVVTPAKRRRGVSARLAASGRRHVLNAVPALRAADEALGATRNGKPNQNPARSLGETAEVRPGVGGLMIDAYREFDLDDDAWESTANAILDLIDDLQGAVDHIDRMAERSR